MVRAPHYSYILFSISSQEDLHVAEMLRLCSHFPHFLVAETWHIRELSLSAPHACARDLHHRCVFDDGHLLHDHGDFRACYHATTHGLSEAP